MTVSEGNPGLSRRDRKQLHTESPTTYRSEWVSRESHLGIPYATSYLRFEAVTRVRARKLQGMGRSGFRVYDRQPSKPTLRGLFHSKPFLQTRGSQTNQTLSHVGSNTCRCSFLARHVETVIGCSRNLRARLSSRKRHTPGQFTFPSFFPSISTPYGDIRCKLLPPDYVSFREDFIDRFTIAINHARHTMASGGPLRSWPVRHSSIPANSGCPCYEQQ